MNPSVILIDDYHDVTEVISEYLGFFSVNVLATGSNGKEAVELYKKHMPDVVVSDFLMPKYDGLYEVQEILKINPNAKIIMLTGSIDPKIHEKLKDAGVAHILPKPTPLNTLIEIIKQTASDNTISLKN